MLLVPRRLQTCRLLLCSLVVLAGCASTPSDLAVTQIIRLKSPDVQHASVENGRSATSSLAREARDTYINSIWLSDDAFDPPLPVAIKRLSFQWQATAKAVLLTRANVGVTRVEPPDRIFGSGPTYVPYVPYGAPAGAVAVGIVVGTGVKQLLESGVRFARGTEYWAVELSAVIDGKEVHVTNREKRGSSAEMTVAFNELLARSVRELFEIRQRLDQ